MILESPLESKLYNLKFGRVNQDTVDIEPLIQEIYNQSYDIIRIRTSASDREVSMKFSGHSIPCFLGGVIQRYSITEQECFEQTMINPGIEFIPFTDQLENQFRKILISSFSSEAGGYYKIPWIPSHVTQEAEANLLADFFISKLKENPKTYQARFAYLEKQFAGIVVYTTQSNELDAVLATIEPNFRKKGIFRDIVRFLKKSVWKEGYTIAFTGARAHNLPAQSVFVDENLRPFENHLIFFLFPLFGRQRNAPREYEFSNEKKNPLSLLVKKPLNGMLKNLHFSQFKEKDFKAFSDSHFDIGTSQQLSIRGFYDETDSLIASSWTEIEKHVP